MSESSDKDVLALETERVLAAARDSLSDEMISRLAGTATDAMDLIDRVNTTGLYRAIPALADLVNNGDLDRLAKLARVYGSAEDALSDEMISRIAETTAEGMSLLDRLNRGGAGRLVELLAHLEASGDLHRIAEAIPRLVDRLDTLEGMLHGFEAAGEATEKGARAAGGLGGLWSMMRDPDNQDALRFLINLGKEMRTRARR
ncbi:MAG: DUF1641 domain-containing protein [Betaproteobacteria bacterium]|jgi:hypothetical protein|nr:DUF1641 domain-containing protein [Betaproteobacteria bacterium]